MDTARCTVNGMTYTAIEFATLGEAGISQLRYDLVCTSCGHKGYFRIAAVSGQGPCFGANPHADDCDLATHVDDPWGEIGNELVQRMEADQTRIVLNLGSKATRAEGALTAEGSEGAHGRRFASGDAPSRTQIQRNPEKLLRMLVEADSFRTSRILLQTDHGDIPVGDFFVSMATASRNIHANRYLGFWGVPRYSTVWNGLRIVNAAPRPSLGFELSDELVAEIMARYHLSAITELRERHVLFIGEPRITSGRSFMMDVPSIRHVAVLPSIVSG